MQGIWQDVRYGLRGLARYPMFTIVAILTLAVGIGATTAIFSVVRGVLLRPLPYRDGARLMNIWVDLGVGNQSLPAVSPGDYLDYRQRANTFEEFAAASGGNIAGASGILTGGAQPEQVVVSTVSANFFPLLGIDPMFGRHFQADEEAANGPRVAMLAEPLWRRRYGADPGLVGRTIELDGAATTVVGIMPRGFRLHLPSEAFLLKDSDIWQPLQVDYRVARPRNLTFFTVFGRLKAGVAVADAQQDMDRLAGELRAEHAEHASSDMRIRVVPLQDDVVKHARPALLMLFAAVGFVLLIACTNIAHLLLARGAMRRRELAVRAALGASKARLVRQMLIESALLAAAGGLAGLVVASTALDVLSAFGPGSLPRRDMIAIDTPVLIFAAAASMLTAALFGLLPAFRAAQVELTTSLKPGVGAPNALAGWQVRHLLVAVEVVLSVMLLCGAGLMVRSFIALQAVRPGFDAAPALTFGLSLPRIHYANGRARIDFVTQLESRLAAVSGVTAVGATSQLPLTGSGPLAPYAYDEQTARNWESATAERRWATPGFFRAMGTTMVAGRGFDDRDGRDERQVIVIDTTLAARAWPGEDAVGKRLQLAPEGGPSGFAEVIGVVEHMRLLDLTRDVRGEIFFPYPQGAPRDISFVVRAAGEPSALASVVADAVRGLDPNLPVERMRPLRAIVSSAREQARFSLVLMALFGAVALILAAIGIYGVISYSVSQRTREIGIRLALGEEPARIRNAVVRDGMRLVLGSLVVGLVLSAALGRVVARLLYGVSPTDALTLGAAGIPLLLAALIGCYLPARRATQVDPVIALRSE